MQRMPIAMQSASRNFLSFLLYSLMGVVTTVLFWGFEIVFDVLFSFEQAKYMGALMGLSAG